jgi:bifunctional UDP-N-acetylglucosamine pyrophosphorylase/glucosamine-1-phosphate N-acetyltransferase
MASTSQTGSAVAILAAGKGTRLKSRRPKVLHAAGGKPMLLHVIQAARQALPQAEIYVIIGHEAAMVRDAAQASGVHFVEQTEQRGTGHAVQCLLAALTAAGSRAKQLVVLSGDVPAIAPETIGALVRFHEQQRAAMTILTAAPANPFGYGRVIRAADGHPEVSAIVEQKALSAAQQGAREINSGIYVFDVAALAGVIGRLTTNNAHGEYYLTDVAALLAKAGQRVVALEAKSAAEVLGANTIAELMELDSAMRLKKARELMAAGVTIYSPETVVIDNDVEVGADTVIEPSVQLLGKTRIGSNCILRSFSVIEDSTLADGVLVRQGCVLESADVGAGAKLGPYAHLRPGSKIGADAHVGNFVETKNARLGDGAKANHLSYLGDTEIGAGANIGAGTITCNFDGVNKHTTRIGAGAFVGSDSTLVAPITIGAGAYIAAGSAITEDVPDGALALGRSRQTTKPGWVATRKNKKKK